MTPRFTRKGQSVIQERFQRFVATALLGLLLLGPAVLYGAEPAAGQSDAVVVLNAGSYWRYFITCRRPVMRKEQELAEMKGVFADTALPPAQWSAPDFDDHLWGHMRGPFFRTARNHAYVPAVEGKGYTMYEQGGPGMALLCARAKFTVTDLAKAGDLTLSLAYRGGAVVYLNGQEVARSHLPAAAKDGLDALAEDYDNDVCLDAGGKLISIGDHATKNADRLQRRIRQLTDVRIPASRLRQGTNVLAVEIHRSPYPKAILKSVAAHNYQVFDWVPLGLVGLELKTATTGIEANVGRPKGVQVWTHCPSQRVYVDEYGDPTGPLRLVKIAAARNGAFAGQVLVGSTEALRGLKVQPSELTGPGTIPAAAVEVRYPLPDGKPGGMAPFDGGQGYPDCFDSLETAAPLEVVPKKGASGVVQPLWLTVRVPKGAKPGEYRGKVAVQVEDAAAVEVPIEVSVADWPLPDPKNFQTEVGLVESPESVALRYGVELWSEEHWRLLDQVFALLGQVGADDVFLLLQRQLHFGNEQSMVRWVKKEGDGYTHDFSIVERYLDLAIKHLGKPAVVGLVAWDKGDGMRYFGSSENAVPVKHGVLFTAVDPKTGKLEEAEGPKYGTPEAREFWKPVFDGLRRILTERGLEQSMMLGVMGDIIPTREAFADLSAVAPGVKWVMHRHPEPREPIWGRPMKECLGAYAYVYVGNDLPDPAVERRYGWQGDFRRAVFARDVWDHTNPGYYRVVLEKFMTKGFLGFARMGADFWDVLKPNVNRTQFGGRTICNRYPETDWMQTSITVSAKRLIAAGTKGPLSTVRLEMLRATAQECEARVVIEKALLDPAAKARLGEALAGHCQEVLDERQRDLIACSQSWWCFNGWSWESRAGELYRLAAEVAKAQGK
jgi:hypothetical protein